MSARTTQSWVSYLDKGQMSTKGGSYKNLKHGIAEVKFQICRHDADTFIQALVCPA